MLSANDELDESQITAMDLPLDFKVNLSFFVIEREITLAESAEHGPVIHKIATSDPSFHPILSSATSVLQKN